MFDDRTYENIMQEMMDGFGSDVNTDESSLAYNASSKIAEQLEDTYGEMDSLNDNMVPDRMDLEHLIGYGELQGIEYRYAQAPVVKAVFKQTIDIGQQFTCNDYTYTVTELIEGYVYKLACETEGVEANTNKGSLEPIDYIDEYLGGEITEILQLGTNDEDTEEYRKRVTTREKTLAFGGNKADYREKIDKMEGVGGCKPMRREKGSPWINIYVIASDYGPLSQTKINELQTIIDPEQNHGEGDGIAPICHEVLILATTAININVETKITVDSGRTKEELKNQIEEAIADYLLQIRKSWESSGESNQYVRVSQIETRVLSIDGIIDISDTKINGKAENFTLKLNEIPMFGGVKIV